MKKGAIFDMDGLMFDTEALWQQGWRKLSKEFGYEPSEDFSRDISGTSGKVMEGIVEKYYPGIDAKEFIKRERNFVEDCLKEDVPMKPGLLFILDMFSKYEVRMAVASSSDKKRILENLRRTGTEKYFSAVLSSTQVENPKPAPDVFILAAKELGLRPEDCYVLEDSFGGIRAAAASGAAAILIPDQQVPTDEIRELADGMFTDLAVCARAIENGEV